MLYLLAFHSLRKYLIAEGVVDQLRKINKYSAAGVVVTATDEDHITYKIVQDEERPDLVCEMFLFGEDGGPGEEKEKWHLNANGICEIIQEPKQNKEGFQQS